MSSRWPLLVLLFLVPSCGPGVNRAELLGELRAAITEEVPDEDVLDRHNAIVTRVRETDVLQGMRRSEVEEALGELCRALPEGACAGPSIRKEAILVPSSQ